jgi:hypothetical protein
MTVEGRFGVAVQVIDRADASALTNRLAPHRLQLLVDGREVFQTTYASLDYDRIHQGDLDRNLALNRRGLGTYHALYRATGNELPLYGPYRMGDGVLHAGRRAGRKGRALEPGQHLLRVVAQDAAGNRSEADLTVKVHSALDVLDAHAEARGDLAVVSARVVGSAAKADVIVEASKDGGRTWRGGTVKTIEPGREVSLTVPARPEGIYRIRALGPAGEEAFGTCAPVESVVGAAIGDMLELRVRSYPSFAVIAVESDRVLSGPPRIRARWPRGMDRTLAVRQRALRSYEALLRFNPEQSGPVDVTISAVDLAGGAGHGTTSVVQQPVAREGGTVRSSDGRAEARFSPDGVYEAFFARAEEQDLPGPEGLPSIGAAYRFTPDDVPFNRQATVVIRYPAGFERPERLGVYEFDADSSWTFLGNGHDAGAGTVAASVWHFSTYGLLLDEIPPVVTNLRPAPGTETGDRRPRLEAELRDRGAGIEREEDISVLLDGRGLIFEYDPEEERLAAQQKRPLVPGTHRLEITVRDMCGNETRAVSEFTVR